MKTGAQLIVQERERQITTEGYTADHDRGNTSDALAAAAVVYAAPDNHELLALWPWDMAFYKPKDRLADLIRAGALIAAAIDRLQDEGGG